jgi:hypothetical protein
MCPRPRCQAGQQDPDIFFTDRPRQGAGLGQRNKEYVSFWADDEPVLAGRTPMQVGGRRGPGALGAGRGHVLRVSGGLGCQGDGMPPWWA